MAINRLKALLRPLLFRARSAQVLWMQADIAEAHGDHSGAAAIYQRLANATLRTPAAYVYAGLAEQRLQRPMRAIEVFEAGLARYPNMPLLLEHYIRVCSESDQIDRVVRRMAAGKDDERRVCDVLFEQYPDSNVQMSLIAYGLHNGITDLAEHKLEQLQKSDDNILLWRLADLLLTHQRDEDAKRIYGRLATRPFDSPLGLLHSALSEYRLGNSSRAADLLEAGIQRFPQTVDLLDQYALICIQLGQTERVLRVAAPTATSKERACEAIFERFSDPQIQVGLIDHCLSVGLDTLAERRIRWIKENSDSTLALWQVSEMLLCRDRVPEANEIHRKLAERAAKNSEDYHLSSLAYVCLSKLDECLELLEEGLLKFPSASKLLALYMKICANRFEYDRYHDFLGLLESGRLPSAVSMLDFYRASMSAPVDFVINFQDIALLLDEDDFAELKLDFSAYLRANPQQIQIAKVLVFFCRYLHLPADFAAAVYEALHFACVDDAKGSRALRILNDMTPPMIPRYPIQPDAVVGDFIEVALGIAETAQPLSEPIADMTNNWTPWQYIFCLVAPESYGNAINAFEKVAFSTWPKLAFTAPHVQDASNSHQRAGRKIRVGFIVHDSMPMMSGFLPLLDKDRFETVFLRPGKQGNSVAAKNWVARADKTVQYSDTDMYAAIDMIANEELDIIVSGPSIAAVYYPMMARLAPLQMVLLEPNWTDGLTHSDYYISWQSAEPVNPSDFYKTNVSYFQHPPYWIERPEVQEKGPITLEERTAVRKKLLNVGEESRVYLCANTPPKIHPDMDGLFRDILERDPNGLLVLLRGEYPPAKSLRSRLRETLGACYERVVFISTMSKDDAHMLLQSADCCLDSFPLCGMSSSFDGAMLGIATVTLPADIPFGRWTAAIYEYIGVTELVAKDRQNYVDIALRLASNKEWRDRLSLQIQEQASRYVESQISSKEFETFLGSAWDRKLAGFAPANWINGRWQ